MRKMKKNKRLIRISIGVTLALLTIMTVGYAAFSTNISLNAKGNIKGLRAALYLKSICTATSGDGLYADPVEENRCVYRGTNPNNYITFNNETWRIVAVEADDTLKIMRDESIGSMVFDPGKTTSIPGVTDSGSDIGTRIDGADYDTDFCWYSLAYAGAGYAGCNLWGSKTTMLDQSGNNITTMPMEIGGEEYNLPEIEAYINTYLNTTYYNSINDDKNYIDNHLFNVGLVSYPFNRTLSDDVAQEKLYKWRGKIGLIGPTDYVKGSLNANCSDITAAYNTTACKNNNYLNKTNDYWTMVLLADFLMSNVYDIAPDNEYVAGSIYSEFAFENKDTIPALYLKSNITLSGDGSTTNPYTID